MTLKEIVAFSDLYKKIEHQQLNIQTAYKFAKINAQFEQSYKLYTEQVQKVINECGERDLEGKLIETNEGVKIKADKLEECQEKINSLLESESGDIKCDITFDIGELHELHLTVADMAVLLPYIK